MLNIRPTSRFQKDLKHAIKQGHNLERLKFALEALAAPEPLPPDFRDHKLKGKWRDFR
jgi:mRNA interferase YafQ